VLAVAEMRRNILGKEFSQQRCRQNTGATEKIEKGRRLTYVLRYCVFQNVGQPIFHSSVLWKKRMNLISHMIPIFW
jgi:hypothetical protein